MNGVGPLIAASPTPHSDPNLVGIQPVDIHQFSQSTPAIWPGLEPLDAAQGGLPPPPQHVPLPPTLQPSPYAQMVFRCLSLSHCILWIFEKIFWFFTRLHEVSVVFKFSVPLSGRARVDNERRENVVHRIL
ncbi:unnamed protein product [Gongylonema pulchrum]|uniref:Uncharacterized protein n=1 Tax=Gongylonema pulchrum TaxID=637853 RepID=A0A183DMN5_9BILA|nr:unnamed protein product [Gongylonema pulchrum]